MKDSSTEQHSSLLKSPENVVKVNILLGALGQGLKTVFLLSSLIMLML